MISKLNIANLPTKIVKAQRLSEDWGVNLYIKRDDQTGSEVSGNKIRKLEYLIKEAVEKGCDTLITTGGIQSNHCRATAAAATMLGLKTVLLLRINEEPVIEGNYFLDKLFGAEVRFCSPDEYRNSRDDIMAGIAKEMDAKGRKCYIIPEGASNGLGSMGYYEAMEEICEQERESGINFEIVVVAVGSGGTYSGLCIANKALKLNKRVIGFAVCDDSPYFTNRIDKINHDAERITGKDWKLSLSDIEINDKYVGIGYAISRPEELTFITEIASREALVLDPVYTGKAMYGLYNEIIEGRIAKGSTILFIHTGGLFGLFPKQNQFSFI